MPALDRVKSLLRFAVGCLLFGYVLYSAGLLDSQGWRRFFGTLASAQPVLLMVSLVMQPIQQVQIAYKWYVLVRALSLQTSFRYLLRCYLIGRFFNMVVPGGVGGDLTRAHLLAKQTGRVDEAVASVVADRIVGLLVLLVLTWMTLPFVVADQLRLATWLSLYLSTPLLAWMSYLLFMRVSARLGKLSGARQGVIGKCVARCSSVVALLGVLFRSKDAKVHTIAQSLLFYLLSVINVWITTAVFMDDFLLVSAFAAVPLMMVITNLPVSIGNLGTLELSYVLVLGLFGVDADIALASALLMRMKMLGGVLMGGLLLFRKDAGKSQCP